MAQVGVFGDIVFQVSSDLVETFETLRRRSRYVYADHATVLGKPASEYTGPDLDDVSLTMTLNAVLGVSPKAEVDKLRDMGLGGKAHQLMVGGGVLGFFTVREVGDGRVHSLEGDPLVVEVEVAVREYVESLPGAGSEAAARDAANRGTTGAGGPERAPGGSAPLRRRELTVER